MIETLHLWRLAPSNTGVPDDAPTHIRWRTVEAAMADMERWCRAQYDAGTAIARRPGSMEHFYSGPVCREWRPTSFSVDRHEGTYLRVWHDWEWRDGRDVVEQASTVIDGVKFVAEAKAVRVYDSEWIALPAPALYEYHRGQKLPTRTARWIPFVACTVEISDGEA